MNKKIYVVGLGAWEQEIVMTVQGKKVLDACPVINGYTVYNPVSGPLFPEVPLDNLMRKEAESL